MAACIQYAFHMIETLCLRGGILPFKANVIQENNGEAPFHQECLVFVHILYVCKNRVFYFRNYLVFIAILFEEVKSLC